MNYPEAHRDESRREPPGFGRLARKIAGRTTDLLAISIVLVAGLSLGRQVVHWWSREPVDVLADDDAASQRQSIPRLGQLQFGDQPFRVTREAFAGSPGEMLDRLAEACAEGARGIGPISGPPQPAELRMIEALERLEPVREIPGRQAVYVAELPLPVAVVTRERAESRDREEGEGGRRGEGENQDGASPPVSRLPNLDPRSPSKTGSDADETPDTPARRVVCWGLAWPSEERAWTLYTLQPIDRPRQVPSELPRLPLPRGCRRILSLRDASGGAMIAVEGPGEAGDWIEHFNTWLASRGWRLAAEWKSSRDGATARFLSQSEATPRRIEISLSPAHENRLSGLISISPSQDERDHAH